MATTSGQVVEVGGRRIRLTNLEKVMYPDTGTTKGEVIAYYAAIAPRLLPLLRDRPVTRKRWVKGVGTAEHPAPAFFAKQIEAGTPGWVKRLPIAHIHVAKEYPIVNDLPTLVWLAQVASMELHTPQWRFAADGSPAHPDRFVLDLDPGPGVSLAQCAHIAQIARGMLRDMGLDPIPVTSGSKGIHLYAHLDGRYTSDQASAVARELARAIESDAPDLVTSTMAKASRAGKVFLDWAQNSAAQSTISPYSLRGLSRPMVAAPRTWEELDDSQLAQLEMQQVLDRSVDAAPEPSTVGHEIRADLFFKTADEAGATPANNRTVLPADFIPKAMLAEPGTPALAKALGDPAWVEVKWDGIRAMGVWQAGRLRLYARSGREITHRYPELTADGAPHFIAEDAIVDGEIVAFDESHVPSFSRLQRRMHLDRAREIEREVIRTPIAYQLFDLQWLNGEDLKSHPLRVRRRFLEALALTASEPLSVPPLLDDVDSALAASQELGLEGLVVKDAESPYRAGTRSPSWIKLVNTLTQEVVIAGIRPRRGEHEGTIGSLLLAVPDAGSLRYVGRVGTGFTDRALSQLMEQLTPLITSTTPLTGVPDADAKDTIWVSPQLVAEVEFSAWSPGGSLRHPRWRGLRPDKTVADISP